MNDDDPVCLCFGVSQRKIVKYLQRERPAHVSRISECLGAGTGCRWCVPFLKKLHRQVTDGVQNPGLPIAPGEYARRRAAYRKSRTRREEE